MNAQDWRAAVLENLMQNGSVCQRAARYITAHDTEIGFARQSTRAKWTLDRRIELNPVFYPPDTHPANRSMLGAVVHEATHLEQGAALALSVMGELGGWKAEFDAREELNAPILDPHWMAVARTPDPPTNDDLRQVRREMIAMAGYRYLIWLLPLRPNVWTRFVARVQAIFLPKGERA